MGTNSSQVQDLSDSISTISIPSELAVGISSSTLANSLDWPFCQVFPFGFLSVKYDTFHILFVHKNKNGGPPSCMLQLWFLPRNVLIS